DRGEPFGGGGESDAGGRGEEVEMARDRMLAALDDKQVDAEVPATVRAPAGVSGLALRRRAVDLWLQEAIVGGLEHGRGEIGMRGEQAQVREARRRSTLADHQHR